MALFTVVVVSGVYGVLLQQYVPRLMFDRLPLETVYEQIDSVVRQLRDEADVLVVATAGVKEIYLTEIRPYLAAQSPRHARLSTPAVAAALFRHLRTLVPPALHATLGELEAICDERRQLAEQKRLHHWLHGWLLVHVPLSMALLLLAVVHAVVSLRY